MKHFMHRMNKGLRKLIHKKYNTITINEYNTSKKCCDCDNDLDYYKDKEGKKVFRLFVCSNCVSCENKKIVFTKRDDNFLNKHNEIKKLLDRKTRTIIMFPNFVFHILK